MGGTKHEPGVGADVGVLGNEGARVAPLSRTRLEADGFKVLICDDCKGWGYHEYVDPFSDELTRETCKSCGGDKVYLFRQVPKRIRFSEVNRE